MSIEIEATELGDYIVKNDNGDIIGSYAQICIPGAEDRIVYIAWRHDWNNDTEYDKTVECTYDPICIGIYENIGLILGYIEKDARMAQTPDTLQESDYTGYGPIQA